MINRPLARLPSSPTLSTPKHQHQQLSEETIIALLRKEFPGHRFIGEESTFAGTQDATGADATHTPTWYIDPVDGTTNFVHGYPFVAVSIGLAVGGDPVVGVIFLPMLDELYMAWHQGGATCNGKPIRVAGASSVGEALLMNNIGSNRGHWFCDRTLYRLKRLLHGDKLQGLRNSGSAAVNLAHVACGKLDVYYEDGVGGPWDWCAGQVLVQEAGGVVCGLGGGRVELVLGRKGKLVAGNKEVVGDVVRKLKAADRRYLVRRTYDLLALASTLYVGARLLSAVAERRKR
jgi:fructose-1,6-bisphosphatase/inositol monophosphatase family enzyme